MSQLRPASSRVSQDCTFCHGRGWESARRPRFHLAISATSDLRVPPSGPLRYLCRRGTKLFLDGNQGPNDPGAHPGLSACLYDGWADNTKYSTPPTALPSISHSYKRQQGNTSILGRQCVGPPGCALSPMLVCCKEATAEQLSFMPVLSQRRSLWNQYPCARASIFDLHRNVS